MLALVGCGALRGGAACVGRPTVFAIAASGLGGVAAIVGHVVLVAVVRRAPAHALRPLALAARPLARAASLAWRHSARARA